MVISGHTHSMAVIPPTTTFPYIQVTGGGPSKTTATFMYVQANKDCFTLSINDMSGELIKTVSLSPLA